MSDQSGHTLLTDNEQRALNAAREAQTRAYAPYSQRRVGAAVITADGSVFAGCNVENATDGLGVCAERNAVAAAIAAGQRQFRTVIVVAPDGRLWPPCDQCRPVLTEFTSDCEVIMATPNGDIRRARLSEIGSRPFDPGAERAST
ncbi:MAG TPA: cytidine deaminase [Acidobacteriota bacterium]|nr:cytidine deaminase [Acidobacteriota bacterium]